MNFFGYLPILDIIITIMLKMCGIAVAFKVLQALNTYIRKNM